MAKPNDHVPKGTHANDRSTELQFEPEVQIFIIRIWLKPREIKGADIEWLGVIEHVPSANRCYFDDLATLKKFIRPYLKNIGVVFGINAFLQKTWRRWRSQIADKLHIG